MSYQIVFEEVQVEVLKIPPSAQIPEGAVQLVFLNPPTGVKFPVTMPLFEARRVASSILALSSFAETNGAPFPEPVYGAEPTPEDFDKAAQDGRADIEG